MGDIPPCCGAPQHERSSDGMAAAHLLTGGPSGSRWGNFRAPPMRNRAAEVVILVEGSCCKGSPKPLQGEPLPSLRRTRGGIRAK
jgi:hypothetical protein